MNNILSFTNQAAVLLLTACLALPPLHAQPPTGAKETSPPPPPPPPPTSAAPPAPAPGQPPVAITPVGPGLFDLGQIRLDLHQRTVSFPAVLNLAAAPMEYFLVTSYGKTHESILKTDVAPLDIHVAMLLLGANGIGTNRLPTELLDEPLGPVRNPSKAVLPGDKVALELTWRTNGQEIQHRAEDLVFNLQNQSALTNAHWVYTGSRMARGKFAAQMEGSIVSLITDPFALINNVGPGHENDHIWMANTNKLPPPNVPVQVRIKLQPPAHP